MLPDWTPASIPGLRLWLRADTGPVTDRQGHVVLWMDARCPAWDIRWHQWLQDHRLLRPWLTFDRAMQWLLGAFAPSHHAPGPAWRGPSRWASGTVVRFDGVDDYLRH